MNAFSRCPVILAFMPKRYTNVGTIQLTTVTYLPRSIELIPMKSSSYTTFTQISKCSMINLFGTSNKKGRLHNHLNTIDYKKCFVPFLSNDSAHIQMYMSK